jgi:hypothetical protein
VGVADVIQGNTVGAFQHGVIGLPVGGVVVEEEAEGR